MDEKQEQKITRLFTMVICGILALIAIQFAKPSAELPPITVTQGDDSATGNTVTVNLDKPLPDSPRTVQQVADYLDVTSDTIRDSYIPEWIRAGHMSPEDKHRNRWLIPETFEPYKPK